MRPVVGIRIMHIDLINADPVIRREAADPTEVARLGNIFQGHLTRKRFQVDPDNEWSSLEPHLDDEQLQVLRDAAIKLDGAQGFNLDTIGYSCDACGARRTCPAVFDTYNTHGDCLMEK